MSTVIHPMSTRDAGRVPQLVARVLGSPDSGQLLLREAAPSPEYVASPCAAGEWVAAPGTADGGAIVYLHARRFQFEEPADVLASRLSAATGWPVLLVRYRLAPAHPYPAALDDTITAYRGLLAQGLPPGRVVLIGHSAGATLALQALLRLRASDDPLPAAAVTISPITDFTFAGESITTNAGHDVVSAGEMEQVRAAFLGDADPAGAASPLTGVCAGLPPLMMASGTAEVLRDDSVRFAEQADALGNDVTLELYEGMPHGFPVLATDATGVLLDRIAAFTAQHLGGRSGEATGPLTIRRIGWAGYVLTTERGTKVLVDPYLGGDEGIHSGLPESPVTPSELADVDVVAVTHAGYDHHGQAVQIARDAGALLVCGTALQKSAAAAGIPAERIAMTVSGVQVRYRDVTIKSLPARHESTMVMDGGFVADQPQSFVVGTAAGSTVFCGGDSSLSQDMRTWGELYRPDVAILGIGGVWVGAAQTVELPPAEAAIAARWLGAPTVIPVHHHPGDSAPTQLAAELLNDPITVIPLNFNQTWTA